MIVTRIGVTPRCTNRARDASNCHSPLPLTDGGFSPYVDRFATRAQTPEVQRVDEYDAWHRVCSVFYVNRNGCLLVMNKGLFAGATLEGAKLSDDDSDNEKFYGKPMTIRAITAADFASSALPLAAREWRVSLARLAGAAVR